MWVAYDYKVEYKMSAKMIFRRGRVSLIAFTVCLTGLSKLCKWLVLTLLLFSHSVMSNSLQPHGLQHTRLPCPSPSPGACSNSCSLSQWCHLTISSSVSLASPPAFNLSQHQDLFQWVSSSHQMARVLELQLQHQPFQWIFRTDFLSDWWVLQNYGWGWTWIGIQIYLTPKPRF